MRSMAIATILFWCVHSLSSSLELAAPVDKRLMDLMHDEILAHIAFLITSKRNLEDALLDAYALRLVCKKFLETTDINRQLINGLKLTLCNKFYKLSTVQESKLCDFAASTVLRGTPAEKRHLRALCRVLRMSCFDFLLKTTVLWTENGYACPATPQQAFLQNVFFDIREFQLPPEVVAVFPSRLNRLLSETQEVSAETSRELQSIRSVVGASIEKMYQGDLKSKLQDAHTETPVARQQPSYMQLAELIFPWHLRSEELNPQAFRDKIQGFTFAEEDKRLFEAVCTGPDNEVRDLLREKQFPHLTKNVASLLAYFHKREVLADELLTFSTECREPDAPLARMRHFVRFLQAYLAVAIPLAHTHYGTTIPKRLYQLILDCSLKKNELIHQAHALVIPLLHGSEKKPLLNALMELLSTHVSSTEETKEMSQCILAAYNNDEKPQRSKIFQTLNIHTKEREFAKKLGCALILAARRGNRAPIACSWGRPHIVKEYGGMLSVEYLEELMAQSLMHKHSSVLLSELAEWRRIALNERQNAGSYDPLVF
jgi:hypothetical protein